MRLYIAEKREVAGAISAALDGPSRPSGASYELANGDRITWLSGHLLRLTDPEEHNERFGKWSLDDLPLTWPITYAPGERADHLKQVITLAERATELVNAGDPDPEGQRLVDEVIEYAGLESKPVKRILINDNNPAPIRAAIAGIEDNASYRGLSLSALARAVCDQRYGYNLTRCYTLLGRAKGYDGVLSVGRVQTPILGLVVARDRAHEGHAKQAYYVIRALIDSDPESGTVVTLDAAYQPAEGDPLDEKGRVLDAAFADGIVAAVQGQPASILSVDTKDRERAAPLPYNLLALQADAAGLWGYKPKDVLAITQRLRDQHQAITYNRSDCRYLNDERHAEAPEVLTALAGAYGDVATAADPQRKSKAFNTKKVGAHHAIIPTLTVPDLDQLAKEERRIYDLVARSYLAQFYPLEQWRSTTVLLQAADHRFKAIGRVDVAPGWRVLYWDQAKTNGADGEGDQGETEQQISLEHLSTADKGVVTEAMAKQEYTKPPPRYSMKALLKDLARVAKYVTDPKIKALLLAKDADKGDEAGGIGTPATRDAHLDTLFRRGFLAEQGKHVISTELGRNFHDALPTFATAPDMTALWHEQQQRIEAGELDYTALLDEVDQAIGAEIERVRSQGLDLQVDAVQCPNCKQGHLRRRKGKKGLFWGCSRYPDCSATFPDKSGKPDLSRKPAAPPAPTGIACPECGKDLAHRTGTSKKGKPYDFWSCTGYPECKATFDAGPNEKPIFPTDDEPECPKCGKTLKRRTGTGRKGPYDFFGCTGYPECDASFDTGPDGRPVFPEE